MVSLQAIRAASGALFTVSLGAGLAITFDNEPNDGTTYLLFYGLAVILVLVAFATTIVIERRKKTALDRAPYGDQYTVRSDRQSGGTTAGRIEKGHDSSG